MAFLHLLLGPLIAVLMLSTLLPVIQSQDEVSSTIVGAKMVNSPTSITTPPVEKFERSDAVTAVKIQDVAATKSGDIEETSPIIITTPPVLTTTANIENSATKMTSPPVKKLESSEAVIVVKKQDVAANTTANMEENSTTGKKSSTMGKLKTSGPAFVVWIAALNASAAAITENSPATPLSGKLEKSVTATNVQSRNMVTDKNAKAIKEHSKVQMRKMATATIEKSADSDAAIVVRNQDESPAEEASTKGVETSASGAAIVNCKFENSIFTILVFIGWCIYFRM